MHGYECDLAYVHDVGFGDFAREAAPGVLAVLRNAGIIRGLVVDLGCGSGIWAAALIRSGYDVLGIDISKAMIHLARRRAPAARFVHASLLVANLPPCDAVTSIGECLNYTFDRRNTWRGLRSLFRRIYDALQPGGVFIFDIAEAGQMPRRSYSVGKDWAILFEAQPRRGLLIRRMTVFRRLGKLYRRSQEMHRLRLYRREDVAAELRYTGFNLHVLNAYGRFELPPAHAVFVASKTRPKRARPRTR